MAFKMNGKSPMAKALVGKQHNLPERLKAKIEASPMKNVGASTAEVLTGLAGNTMKDSGSPMMKGKKYGDRSRKEMRQDISEERRILKEGGATREEVKEFNKYQRARKGAISSAARANK